MKILAVLIAATTMVFTAALAHEGHDEQNEASKTVTGEVVDMACYLDHGATGAKHADCAKTCIESGLPVGIKGTDGKTYLLIGEHKPANKELAQYAGKTITVSGKVASRDGINLIENVEIVTGQKPTAAAKYTCPMHPDVVSDKPGKCSKCGMNLVAKP